MRIRSLFSRLKRREITPEEQARLARDKVRMQLGDLENRQKKRPKKPNILRGDQFDDFGL